MNKEIETMANDLHNTWIKAREEQNTNGDGSKSLFEMMATRLLQMGFRKTEESSTENKKENISLEKLKDYVSKMKSEIKNLEETAKEKVETRRKKERVKWVEVYEYLKNEIVPIAPHQIKLYDKYYLYLKSDNYNGHWTIVYNENGTGESLYKDVYTCLDDDYPKEDFLGYGDEIKVFFVQNWDVIKTQVLANVYQEIQSRFEKKVDQLQKTII